jgi:hypothetical protein
MHRAFKIEIREANGVVNLPVNEQDIAQYGKQVGLQGTDNTPVNEGLFRGLISSSFTPRSRRSTLISKFSKRDSSSLLLSVRLPELSTASEQLRKS